jgi:hypothetical protein
LTAIRGDRESDIDPCDPPQQLSGDPHSRAIHDQRSGDFRTLIVTNP